MCNRNESSLARVARTATGVPGATKHPGSEDEPARWRQAQAFVVAALLSTLGFPPAHAGRIAVERPPVVERKPVAAPGYQVRCWQYGRLLFEERGVELDSAHTQGLKLSGLDGRKLPVMVTDTGNATCLLRRTPAPSRPGRAD